MNGDGSGEAPDSPDGAGRVSLRGDGAGRNPTEPVRTVAERARASVEVRGSEFVGYVAPVEDVAGAESFAGTVRDRHPDATHVVPAHRVRTGEGYLREYASDDGEPAGSAGEPALGVLSGRDLENVAVAIARYYGGTDLGVGGLVSAYGRTAGAAVDAAGVVEREPRERFRATVGYDDSGTVRSVLESADVAFEATYEASVRFDVTVPVGAAEALRDRLRSATSGRVELSAPPTE